MRGILNRKAGLLATGKQIARTAPLVVAIVVVIILIVIVVTVAVARPAAEGAQSSEAGPLLGLLRGR